MSKKRKMRKVRKALVSCIAGSPIPKQPLLRHCGVDRAFTGPNAPSPGPLGRLGLSETSLAQPEHAYEQDPEQRHVERDHAGRNPESWGEGPGRPITHDLVDMPSQPSGGSDKAHETHDPGERHPQQKEGYLTTDRHLAPCNRPDRMRIFHNCPIDEQADDQRRECAQGLRERKADTNVRGEVESIDRYTYDVHKRSAEDRSDNKIPGPCPRRGDDLVSPLIEDVAQR